MQKKLTSIFSFEIFVIYLPILPIRKTVRQSYNIV